MGRSSGLLEMIETREDFAQINAALADTVPVEHEELLQLIEALREVARVGANSIQRILVSNDEAEWGLALRELNQVLINLPAWIAEDDR